MPTQDQDLLETLLASALAAFDDGGDAALQQFLGQHEPQRAALERGLARCRQMGLLGTATPARDFPDRLGEFQLLRRLGSGGMGVVYEAEQASLGRRVALKVVRPELLYFEGARERFRREIEAVARLSHPAIVPVLASGEQDGLPWYAMELLHGKSVHEVCLELRSRDPAELRAEHLRTVLAADPGTGTDALAGSWWQVCTRIVHAVAIGVRHAHLRGIVHRDIKPSNIMLTKDGRTVLLDFGIAMVGGGREFTRTGNTPGSPAFMSPEQLRGDAVDERTDVYSLAATLWQMLTLVPPFVGVSDLQRIRDGEVPSLRTKNREVPHELELVVQTAMDRDRERRYHDVEAFATDLLAVLQRRPIQARRLRLPLRAWRWCQRHRVAATALASLFVVALVLPFGVAWRERAINSELQAAVTRADESFITTLDAIESMLVTLANERLRFVPEAESATLEALQHACAMYRTLLANDPGHTRLRGDAAHAMNRLAATLLRTGEREPAARTYQEAILTIGAERGDLDADLLEVRASAHLNLAALHKEHSAEQQGGTLMRQHLNAAERDYRALGELPHRLGAALFGRAQIASLRCDLPEVATDRAVSRSGLQAALDLSRQALEVQPTNVEFQAALVRNLDNFATFLCADHSDGAAEPMLDEALTIVRTIPVAARIWPPQNVLESDVLETLGNLYLRANDDRTRATLEACITLRERAAGEHPDDIDLRTRLGGARHNLARTWCGNGASLADLEQALPLLDLAIADQRRIRAKAPGYERARAFLMLHLRLRGNCLARLARREELVAVAEELGTDVDNPTHLRANARFWLRAAEMLEPEPAEANAALRARYEMAALDSLLAAERAGWDGTSQLTEALYRPLESLPAFQELRVRIQAKLDQRPPK